MIQCERRLVFGNGLVPSVLRAQHIAFGEMRKRIAGRGRKGLIDQPFGACEVGCGRVGHSAEHTSHKYERQSALCLDGLGIERECVLEQINCFPEDVRRPSLQ